jgi:hypothetical protein
MSQCFTAVTEWFHYLPLLLMIIQLVKKFPLIKLEGLLLCSQTLQLDDVLSQFQLTYLYPVQ